LAPNPGLRVVRTSPAVVRFLPVDDRRPRDAFTRFRQAVRRWLPKTLDEPAVAKWNAYRRWYRHQRASVFLISYPKAGRTWLRAMVGHALQQHFGLHQLPLTELEQFHDECAEIPRIRVSHDDVRRLGVPGDLSHDKRKYRSKSVVLLVRDPRDIVVSIFFHLKKRDLLLGTDLGDFLTQERSGFGTVLEFHRIWRDNLHVPRRLLLVRYEDLSDNAELELRRVLDFASLTGITDQEVAEAVRFGRFDNMQQMERDGRFGTYRLRPRTPGELDSFKVRRGKVGGYVDYLTQAQVRDLDERLSRAGLECFGYGTATDQQSGQG